jgi:hypothetical protein
MHAAATWPGRAALSMSSCPAATPGPGGGADDCVHDPAPNAIIPPRRITTHHRRLSTQCPTVLYLCTAEYVCARRVLQYDRRAARHPDPRVLSILQVQDGSPGRWE